MVSPLAPRAQRDVQLAGPEWCWCRLGGAREGILAYHGRRGATTLAVPCRVDDHEVVIPLGPFNEVGRLALGLMVTFEVTGRTDEDLRWVVDLTAVAERHLAGPPGTTSEAQRRGAHPAHGAGPDPMDALLLRGVRIRGFFETWTSTRRAGPADQAVLPNAAT